MDKRGNISSRNMRLFAAIMTLIEALILTSLAGCADKKVDYGTDTEKLTKSAVLPPCPKQNTCFAARIRLAASSTASVERAFWVPLMAVIKRAWAWSQRVAVVAPGCSS